MYSKVITTTPIIWFLGAGASRPLGKKLMGEFIDFLEDTRGFRNRPLFREVMARERDLEFLFEELNEWASKDYYCPRPELGLGAPTELGSARMTVSEKFREQFQDVLCRAVDLEIDLRREVFHAYRDISSPQKTVELFGPLFEAILAERTTGLDPLVVFTTNYDPSIETFCTRSAGKYVLRDGFFHDPEATAYVWRRSEFDQFRASTDAVDVVLFKLHGSTSWTKAFGKIMKSPAVYVDSDTAHENVLIYPARRKVALDDPFFTGYDYFQRCAEQCQVCVVIGYSFRDYDALTKLMSAARYNEKLTVVVVDPNAEKLCEDLKLREIKAEPISRPVGFGRNLQDLLPLLRAEIEISLSDQSQTLGRPRGDKS